MEILDKLDLLEEIKLFGGFCAGTMRCFSMFEESVIAGEPEIAEAYEALLVISVRQATHLLRRIERQLG